MIKKIISEKLLTTPKSFHKILGRLAQEEFELCFDSRKYQEGQAFFALKGETVDASLFIPEIIKKKCPLVITENLSLVETLKNSNTTFLICYDSLAYLQELSHLHMAKWKEQDPQRLVIGITGSNGKTTTKEMLFHFLDSAFPGSVYRTMGNLNNHIGVPFTLLSAGKNHKILIVEMGTNHPGEIKFLCDLAKPMAGTITSIGPAHLEFFKTQENIFLEKKTLCDSVVENTNGNGPFVINKEDSYLKKISPFPGLVTFGQGEGDYRISFQNNAVEINKNGEKIILKNENIIGKHNFINLVTSFLLSLSLFPKEKENFIKSSETFTPSSNRSSWVQKGERKIFLDAYNANPGSMKASLQGFVDFLKTSKTSLSDCFFVLGDMNELGEYAPSLHREIGKLVNQLGIDQVAFIGRYAKYYDEGFGGGQKVFESKKSFENEWTSINKKFKFFFIKASRSLQLESLLDIN